MQELTLNTDEGLHKIDEDISADLHPATLVYSSPENSRRYSRRVHSMERVTDSECSGQRPIRQGYDLRSPSRL
jgi:hypothetical protein